MDGEVLHNVELVKDVGFGFGGILLFKECSLGCRWFGWDGIRVSCGGYEDEGLEG